MLKNKYLCTFKTILCMNKEKVDVDLLIETSWEVCNKIGGIYTVLSTKAKTLQKLYKDKNIFIGPDVWTAETPSPFFTETRTPLDKWRKQAELPYGITVRTGRWEIPGRPLVVLVKFDPMYAMNDDLYGEMWKRFRVDSLHAYGDYGEAAAFSHAAALVIEDICRFNGLDKKIIAHFDEWTTGMGLLHVKATLPTVATIFTTHATSIGRSICGNGKPLYDYLKGYNGDQMARELNMEAKHSLEKAAAHNADCFTTVSEITAIECEQLLEIRPAVVTPNGFEANFVPSKTNFESCRDEARCRLMSVASALTGKEYADDTFILATSGRCEYRNKGLDLFLDSISRLKDTKLDRDILAFILVPAWVKEPRTDLVNALEMNQTEALSDRVITHWVNNPDQDMVLNSIHRLGFTNDNDSKVDVIYVPCYLNGNDGIFNTDYYSLLIGMDATVFPSYYEPWGYTPLESVAFGVPTVTNSLSGFGQWILSSSSPIFAKSGVSVIARGDSNYNEVADKISAAVASLDNSTAPQLTAISKAARKTASKAAWTYFIEYYIEAFDIALNNAATRN